MKAAVLVGHMDGLTTVATAVLIRAFDVLQAGVSRYDWQRRCLCSKRSVSGVSTWFRTMTLTVSQLRIAMDLYAPSEVLEKDLLVSE